jgi:hypothetical protein
MRFSLFCMQSQVLYANSKFVYILTVGWSYTQEPANLTFPVPSLQQRIPLDFLEGDKFQEAADNYVRPLLTKVIIVFLNWQFVSTWKVCGTFHLKIFGAYWAACCYLYCYNWSYCATYLVGSTVTFLWFKPTLWAPWEGNTSWSSQQHLLFLILLFVLQLRGAFTGQVWISLIGKHIGAIVS